MLSKLDNGRMISESLVTVNKQDSVKFDYKEQEVSIAQSCQGCKFAEVKGSKQVGCEFDRLKKFGTSTEVVFVEKRYELLRDIDDNYWPDDISLHEKNHFYALAEFHDGEIVKISEPVSEINNLHEVSYYVIHDRYCNLFRNKYSDWAKTKTPKEDARAEITLKISALIYLDSSNTLDQLESSVKSCLAQKLLPTEIIVLNNQSKVQVSDTLRRLLEDTGVRWTNSKCLWESGDVGICFDDTLAQDLIHGQYFFLMNAGITIPENFIATLDKSLNDDLERWMCLTSTDVLVVQTKLAKVLDGYHEVKPIGHGEFIYGLENKIKFFASSMNKEYFVKDLCDVIK